MEDLDRDEVEDQLDTIMNMHNECSVTFLAPLEDDHKDGGAAAGAGKKQAASALLHGKVVVTIKNAAGIKQVPQGGMLGFAKYQDPYVIVEPLWSDDPEQWTGPREFSSGRWLCARVAYCTVLADLLFMRTFEDHYKQQLRAN